MCWTPPATREEGSTGGGAPSAGPGGCAHCFPWARSRVSGAHIPVVHPDIRILQAEERLSEGLCQLGSLVSFQKQAQIALASEGDRKQEGCTRQLCAPDVPEILSAVPLPCFSAKASHE